MIKCKNCGRENEDTFRFCLDCGIRLEPVQATPAEQESKSPIITPSAPVIIKPIIVDSATSTPVPSASISESPPIESSLDAAKPHAAKPHAAKPHAAKPHAAKPHADEPHADEPSANEPHEALRSEPLPPAVASDPIPVGASADRKLVCQKCGNALRPGDVFCSVCGQRQVQDIQRAAATVFLHVASPELSQKPKARLVLIKPDGSEGTVFTLTSEKTIIGREHGAIIFPKDPFISPQHAEITYSDDRLTLTDLDSLNGVYWKMTAETRIVPGAYFRIGRQLLRLEVPGELQPLQLDAPSNDDSQFWGSPSPQIWARLVQILEGGKIGEIHLLSLAEVALGREEGDVRFPGDGTVSARHCMLTNREGDCFIRDLGSSNGTFLRIQKSQPLVSNDRIQIGNQVLRIDLQ
jgi:pSer/pThr/pTyr-binding forkhead associated (FHA) protein